MNNSKTNKQIKKFIICGICAVCIDCLVYFLLSKFINITLSKGISFITGTFFAYILNKYYTFEKRKKSFMEIVNFFILYSISLFVNVYINKFSLILIGSLSILDFQMNKTIAFILATGTSTVINFIGQKFWVFKDNKFN